MTNLKDIHKIYIKSVANGYVVEFDDVDYREEMYVFTDWNEAVAMIATRPPVYTLITTEVPPTSI